MTVYNNSDSAVNDFRRLEPGTSQLATDSRARQRVDRSHVTFTIHPHRINKWSTNESYVFVVVCLPVCRLVSNFAQKLPNGFA